MSTTATLNNWFVRQCSKKEMMFYGDIEGDTQGRWGDGTPIHTSGVKNCKPEQGDIITTRNSTYLLGEPHEHYKR